MYPLEKQQRKFSEKNLRFRNQDSGFDLMRTLKFRFSEKATKFCEISTVYLTVSTKEKSTVEILQRFVAFSEYMNFKRLTLWSDQLEAKTH